MLPYLVFLKKAQYRTYLDIRDMSYSCMLLLWSSAGFPRSASKTCVITFHQKNLNFEKYFYLFKNVFKNSTCCLSERAWSDWKLSECLKIYQPQCNVFRFDRRSSAHTYEVFWTIYSSWKQIQKAAFTTLQVT